MQSDSSDDVDVDGSSTDKHENTNTHTQCVFTFTFTHVRVCWSPETERTTDGRDGIDTPRTKPHKQLWIFAERNGANGLCGAALTRERCDDVMRVRRATSVY